MTAVSFRLRRQRKRRTPLTHEQGYANCIQKIISADHCAPN